MVRAAAARKRVLGLAALFAAACLLALPGPAGAGPAPCTRGQLWVAVGPGPGGAAAGHVSYAIVIHDEHSAPCTLSQRPGLRLLGALAVHVPTHVLYSGPSGTITLAHGTVAEAVAVLSPDIPGPGEPTSGPCEPTSYFLLVSLTGPGAGGGVIGTIDPPTPVCEHGTLSVHAFKVIFVIHKV